MLKFFKRGKFHIALILLLSGVILTYSHKIKADELEDIKQQIVDLQHQLELSVAATKPLEGEVARLGEQISSIQNQINQEKAKQQELERGIEKREKDLEKNYLMLGEKVRDYYKQRRIYSPLLGLLSGLRTVSLAKGIVYREVLMERDKEEIIKTIKEIVQLQTDKEKVVERGKYLQLVQEKLDKQKRFFEHEIAGAKDWQAQLKNKIAELTARQEEILAARSGAVITSVGEVPVGSDYEATLAGFRDKAPEGYFGVFSFGAYTHRKGMSQYGAKGRAMAGQNYKEILKAYYGKEPVKKETGGSIKVADYGEIDFESKYLLGIAEMPSDWPMEALKAQAVAARTYAYRYKEEGKTICTTESCQVFSMSKANNPPEQWKRAVEETRGEILEGVTTYYSSTAGGYLTTMGWDTEDGQDGQEWTTKAWEKKANSPWFYKAWYRNGYRDDSPSCGRKPWLSEEEMADIINAWLVLYKGEGREVEMERILPVTINSCPIGGSSGNPYSMAELRSKLTNPVMRIHGKPISQHDNQGNTVKVVFETNRGSIEVPGSEFKKVFNMRAPGYIAIPQKGFAFFNIERK